MNFFKNLLWFVAYPFVALYIIVQMILAAIMAKKYKNDPEAVNVNDRYKKIMAIIDAVLYLKNIKVDLIGKENVSIKSMLYIGNHKSNGDPLVLLKALYQISPHNVRFVAKIELQKSFLKFLFNLIDVIYIDRNNLRQAISTIDEQVNALKQTYRGLVIFPEGTRNFSHEFNEFKSGTLTAAYNTLSSIQPFVIFNSQGSFESKDDKKQKLRNNPFKTQHIKVSFLEPIHSFNYINVNKNILMRRIQTNIKKNYDELLKSTIKTN